MVLGSPIRAFADLYPVAPQVASSQEPVLPSSDTKADRLGRGPALAYVDGMTKIKDASASTKAKGGETGQSLAVRGAGVLRGRLTLENSVDLTKPIGSQVLLTNDLRGGPAEKGS